MLKRTKLEDAQGRLNAEFAQASKEERQQRGQGDKRWTGRTLSGLRQCRKFTVHIEFTIGDEPDFRTYIRHLQASTRDVQLAALSKGTPKAVQPTSNFEFLYNPIMRRTQDRSISSLFAFLHV